MSKPRGGPAFPKSSKYLECSNNGMDLRDWFAGQALSALDLSKDFENESYEGIAQCVYEMADAMIKERNKE